MFSAALFTGTASAATYYVSPSGNDANPGTLASPFKTISKGAAAALPGDMVQVRAGVYNQQVSIGSKGTAAGRVTIRNYAGETPVIDGTGLASSTDLVIFYKAAYVDFQGFEVRNAPHIGICVYGAQGIRILNNTVYNSQRNGIYAGYSALNVNSDITVTNNDVHDNVLENQFSQMSGGGWASGISVTITNGATITNNRSYRNHGEGIEVGLTNNALVENNVSYDNFSCNIYLDSSRVVTVNRNLVFNTGIAAYYRFGEPAGGIGTANETWSLGTNPTAGLIITNNIVVNSRWGFYYGNFEVGGGLTNCVIANNTFYKGWEALIKIDNDAHSGTVVENNIFDQVGGVMSSVATNGITYRSNLWYGGNAGSAAGAGDITANPMLANAGGTTAADYKLQSNSPALAVGTILSAVTNDYFGVARFGTFDIGAHQLGSGSAVTPVPTLDTTAPSTPASLAAAPAGTSTITLTWSASTDNVGVTGYRITRNGADITTIAGTSYTDGGLAASTTYSYAVRAVDAAGNVSGASNTAAATTSAITPTGDTQAPSAPASLRVGSVTTSAITLAWNAATDNIGVTGYRIARNGVDVATITGTSYTDGGLAASTTYSYAVRAIDAAGNVSVASNAATATTSAATPTTDTQAPSVPGSLRVGSVTASAITLAWNAATDNTAVAGYRIYRNGVFVATAATTTWTDSGLTAATTYSYSAAAYDAAGNVSAQSAAISATTAASKYHGARH